MEANKITRNPWGVSKSLFTPERPPTTDQRKDSTQVYFSLRKFIAVPHRAHVTQRQPGPA